MKIRKFFHGIEYIFIVCLYFVCFPLAYILYGRKHYWIIAEVDFDARDNGLHFFKYLNEHHKDINSLFLISKKNPNFDLINQIGHTLEPFSIKHFLVFIAASVKLATAVNGCSPNSYLTKYFKNHHITGKNIALKHGIFKNTHPNYFKKNAHLDLICCAAKPEYDFVVKNFGYEKQNVALTGLARFDNLHNLVTEKTILIMPTWRRWLDGIVNTNDFKQSDFYKSWIDLLNSVKFKSILKQYNYRVIFYVHPKLNDFRDLFEGASEHIIFMNSRNGNDLQEHLRKSALLITDYSSVFFDFAYMKKPIIFYQFDKERFDKEHYKKGYFDYNRDGFGPVELTAANVIRTINNIIHKDCKLDTLYEDRVNNFFTIRDTNNCQRIFDIVHSIL